MTSHDDIEVQCSFDDMLVFIHRDITPSLEGKVAAHLTVEEAQVSSVKIVIADGRQNSLLVITVVLQKLQ